MRERKSELDGEWGERIAPLFVTYEAVGNADKFRKWHVIFSGQKKKTRGCVLHEIKLVQASLAECFRMCVDTVVCV